MPTGPPPVRTTTAFVSAITRGLDGPALGAGVIAERRERSSGRRSSRRRSGSSGPCRVPLLVATSSGQGTTPTSRIVSPQSQRCRAKAVGRGESALGAGRLDPLDQLPKKSMSSWLTRSAAS